MQIGTKDHFFHSVLREGVIKRFLPRIFFFHGERVVLIFSVSGWTIFPELYTYSIRYSKLAFTNIHIAKSVSQSTLFEVCYTMGMKNTHLKS